jgi:cytochrome P450
MLSLLLLVLCIIFPLLLFFLKRRRTNNASYPPGPRGLPIIGNLHQLDNSILYLQFSKLSKIYGPIFSLQFGLRPAIVVSSSKIAKEIFKNNDIVFSNRPILYGQQKLSYNGFDIAFSPYSDFWRDIRKICAIHIFSTKRVSSYSSIRKFEVKQMIKKISNHASSSVVTNLSELLTSLSSKIICRIAFGRRYEDEGVERSKFQGMLHELETMFTSFFVSDYIPFLGWIDKVSGLRARLERNFNEMDEFYQEVIDEHLDPNRQQIADEEDIVDVLLQLKKQRLFSFDLTFDHIKGVLMVLS